ncbi:protein kinase domain-containing protein [Usitatibacter palustris]|uniref:Serine/threonine-protein kinase PknD n=1 Tax=Usitatibacter palustris TaxID=2732487 RepID=A0A6M4H684_9PROT|nr:protein kinase [Usitatibacter palustris]QJR13417.1 Serine/threonine-protein kinase PknD [Usitatibacter palustris]
MNLPGRIGKYDVQAILGKGAAGTVYRGFDSAIKRPVALKVIAKRDLAVADVEPTLARFRKEAEAVGRLTHSRIAAIYDFIETDEVACIVMELVSGKSLEQHLAEVSQYGFKDTWEIIRQILDGLGYTHAQGVIHRDLKPGNILMNEDGRVKITDFGVARIDTTRLTHPGDVVGTPHYMAPEQFSSGEPTALTDLYQVGVLAYELLTGKRPFTGTSAEILRRVLNERPANPSTHNPRITWQLDWAIQKALSKDPRDRFFSAQELGDALRKGLEESLGGPVASAAIAAAAATPSPAIANLLDKAKLIAGAKDAGVLAGPQPDAAATAMFAAASDTRKARVLFVDDEERILNALRTLFRNQYHVFTAENGTLALEFVKRFGIHVVVSDQRMPGMTGVDLLRQVKEVAPNTVRMLLTGYSDLAAIVGSINDGEVFRFVKKPWDNAEIQRTVGDAVAIAMELAATSTAAATTPVVKYTTPVLVVDPGPDLAEGLRAILGDMVPVRHALTTTDALTTLEEEEVAVIVADLGAGREGLVTLFKLLKAEHPEVLSMVITDDTDSELVIELINEAQVFRFLSKPVNVHHLRGYVDMALRKYTQFKKAPELVRQHAVTESVQAKTSLWGARLFDRIKGLPDRLSTAE